MKKLNVTLLAGCIAMLFMVSTAQAHLVAFGWKDNGNGTVTLWGEHWHGNQISPSTANGGIHISDAATNALLFTAQWTGVANDMPDPNTMVANGTLTGFDVNTGFSSSSADDWFFTDPLVIGNGTFKFFTGTNCCIDTMANPVLITLTGITSVPPGTGPGGINSVPAPGTILLFGSGLAGCLAACRMRKAKKA